LLCGIHPVAMPRQARLDAPGRLHHVMVRGLDRQLLFREDADREDFVARVAMLAASGAWQVYAWALLPNHLHLVVRTGAHPLARSMRSLLTGYAGAFNRRHKRTGHLVQNRYKSIIVEEEVYMLELVRYLHLNPVRALARFPWMGHSALLGAVPRPWQDTATILAQFGPTGRRPELQGCGGVSAGGPPWPPSAGAARPLSATSASWAVAPSWRPCARRCSRWGPRRGPSSPCLPSSPGFARRLASHRRPRSRGAAGGR
jgi:REP element-mobilizing transposase RayT